MTVIPNTTTDTVDVVNFDLKNLPKNEVIKLKVLALTLKKKFPHFTPQRLAKKVVKTYNSDPQVKRKINLVNR